MKNSEVYLPELTTKQKCWPIHSDFIYQYPPELLPPTITSDIHTMYPWELLEVLQTYLHNTITEKRIGNNVTIGNYVDIEGHVWIGDGVEIFPFARIVGPVFIGNNTKIGDRTTIRSSVIGAGTTVGESCKVVRSIIGPGGKFHMNYIGDSFLDEKVDLGGDTKVANRRVDYGPIFSKVDGIKTPTNRNRLGAIIGKNTSFAGVCLTMPGVMVGADCKIFPGVHLYKNLPDNSQVRVIQTLEITNTTP